MVGVPPTWGTVSKSPAIGRLLTTAIWLLSQEKFTLGLAQLALPDNSSYWSVLGTSACVLSWAADSHCEADLMPSLRIENRLLAAQAVAEAEEGPVELRTGPSASIPTPTSSWGHGVTVPSSLFGCLLKLKVTLWPNGRKPLTLGPYSTDRSIENLTEVA